jgi:hypothetical protein
MQNCLNYEKIQVQKIKHFYEIIHYNYFDKSFKDKECSVFLTFV